MVAPPARSQGPDWLNVLRRDVLGPAFGFGWTPCIGPVPGVILTASAASVTIGEGVALLAVCSAETAPKAWSGGERIGGDHEQRACFGLHKRGEEETFYMQVIAISFVGLLMVLATIWTATDRERVG